MIRTGAAAAILLLAAAANTEPSSAPIRLNQIGFETDGPKTAVVETDRDTPIAWRLVDATGRTVASGHSVPFGIDPASGERVQHIDLSEYRRAGDGYRLIAGDRRSRPFTIGGRPFAAVATAAMSFFYQQRSGVPIEARYVQRPDLARAAGHADEIVTCFDGTDQRGVRWPGCGYRLDVTGGWYDAGDHGKYVVNGGIAAWTLLDLYERRVAFGDSDIFADGRLVLPERGNGTDDLLDEARVEVAFLLTMQIPDGNRLRIPVGPSARFREIDAGGLVHTKVADQNWTALPTAPADDRMPRFLYPPSTAATLNLAAVAAQAARIWRRIDPAFATRALVAARRAWDAAGRHPDLLASSAFDGSGGYGDEDVSDEVFWAAAELYVTTGEQRYADAIVASPFLARPSPDLNWGRVDQAGLLTLATIPNRLPRERLSQIAASVTKLADGFVAERARSGYGIPYASRDFVWGSNSVILNRALLLGVAWQITRRPTYRDASVDAIDYVLGRNALDRSYVTGFGARTVHQPHHRFWTHAADPRFPAPPAGALVGGPNSTAMSDGVAAEMQGHCTGQTCWTDDWRAFTMNEVAINWNAPLVWVSAFLDASRAKSREPKR